MKKRSQKLPKGFTPTRDDYVRQEAFIEKLQGDLQEARAEVARLKAHASDWTSRTEALIARLASAKVELDEARATIEDLIAASQKADAFSDQQAARLASAEAQLDEARAQVASLTERVALAREAFRAGFMAYRLDAKTGAWVFDAETCAAGDLESSAWDAWLLASAVGK